MPSGADLVLFVLAATASSAQEPQTIPAFPTQAEAITADVVVLDRQGRPVRGLTKEDFTLLEDGKPQTIVGFQARELAPPGQPPPPEAGAADERVAANQGSSERRGRTFAFLVDDLGTQALSVEDVKKAIAAWLRDKADPRDEVTLATTSGDAWWSDTVGRGRSDLLAVLKRVRGKKLRQPPSEWMTDWEAYRIAVYEDASGAAAASEGAGAGASGPPTSPGSGPVGVSGGAGNPNRLGRVLDRVLGRWLTATKTPSDVRMRAMELYDALTRRIQSVFGSVERLSRGLAGARGRKSILIFSDGFLNDTNQGGLDRAIDASQRGNTAVYFIDAKGLAGQSYYGADFASAPQPLDVGVISMEEVFLEAAGTESLAENTGGASIRNTNDLLGGLERVAEESSVYYLLGYQPEKPLDGKWHKLTVKVAWPGVTVRARRGYQATPPGALEASRPARNAGKTGKKDSSKEPKRPLDPAVMASGGDDAIALRVAPYVLEADKTGLARVLVALEVGTSTIPFSGTGDRQRAALDLTILGLSRDQPRLFPIDERMKLDLEAKATGGWLTLSREIRLPAGVAQVRVLVRDTATGRAGAVTHRLVVPALDRPYLATPILTDRIEMPRGGSARLVPVAHRRFRPQGRLYCVYEVFGMKDSEGRATTRVAGGYTLQAAGGRVVSTAPPTPIAVDLGGRVVRMLALPLDGLDEGEYALVLEVVDQASGRTLVTREAFVLERKVVSRQLTGPSISLLP
jgi:VWFA-related protein